MNVGREENVSINGNIIWILGDFPAESMGAKSQRNHIIEVLKNKNCQLRILSPEKSAFRTEC